MKVTQLNDTFCKTFSALSEFQMFLENRLHCTMIVTPSEVTQSSKRAWTVSAWLTCVFHKLDAFVNKDWNICSRFADRFQWLSEVREIVHFFLSTFEEFVDFFLVFSFFLLYSFQAFFVFSWFLFFFLPLLQRFTLLAWWLLSGWRPRLKEKKTIPIWVPCSIMIHLDLSPRSSLIPRAHILITWQHNHNLYCK